MAKKKSSGKKDIAEAIPLDERIEELVDDVCENGPTTVAQLASRLRWSKPTLRRVAREAERLGVIWRNALL